MHDTFIEFDNKFKLNDEDRKTTLTRKKANINKFFIGTIMIDLNQIIKEIKCIGPFLAPFVKTSCLYFIINPETGTVIHCGVKLLPIIVLIVFVWTQGLSNNRYNQSIIAGLITCALGDAVLVWQEVDDILFLLGMFFFGFGHVFYISAFGLTPFGVKEFFLASVIAVPALKFLAPCLEYPLSYIVPIYGCLLCMLWWRAVARFNLKGDIPWRKIYAALGASLFIISDTILAVNKFCTPIPYEAPLIMFTYYGAQMLIAFSIINSRLITFDPTSSSTCKWKLTPHVYTNTDNVMQHTYTPVPSTE